MLGMNGRKFVNKFLEMAQPKPLEPVIVAAQIKNHELCNPFACAGFKIGDVIRWKNEEKAFGMVLGKCNTHYCILKDNTVVLSINVEGVLEWFELVPDLKLEPNVLKIQMESITYPLRVYNMKQK